MKKITIYSTPTCTYCKMAKELLTEKGIPFESVDVQADIARRKEMIEKSGQMGVPVIDIDGEIMVGFDRDQLLAKAQG
ncbi:MAG: glutaredoxin family protein [Candidatus Pacebacteria bacterium]|nr:glutaredoxin family protein [Candidatus Paceibacterota bacterium]